ncbi:GH92 family glycosyl hydrolase [Ktedonosporobacter rubrisoli]|uniref:GH92 family glycosyl hydrolase n=1 Tax=Ktedonosporobacter rubrisoli TaxID=2509675 RepID=UPI001A9326FA|nr:glycoside hydrolase family 92 protein [Ktedonosporobacter rubrisoli]
MSTRRTRQQANQTWNRYLGEIRVGGGSATQLKTFYTAMYHVLLQPNVFSDVNGQYIGFDAQVHTVARGHEQYANYSGWDIYRSEAQMLAFLAPKEASDVVQSMLNDYEQSGLLPKWSLANGETYTMVGDPADSIIAGIYAFGGRDFDTKAALAAMINEATKTNNNRPGLDYLDKAGYLPMNARYGCCNFYGAASTSATLEYNSADFSIGAFAQAFGDTANYQKFVARAQNWENLYNPADSYLEPRFLDGSFPTSYNPTSGSGWVESDGAQYSWMVPFNLRGLFDAMGGNSKVVQRLNTFFTQFNGGPNSPYAFLGNEPTLETPWEYDFAGAPYRTQQVVRQVENTIWYPGPEGLAGNDDLGAMSSWYVFAALGFFPETPGTADVVLSSPLFPSITVHRPSGQIFQINAPGASSNMYYIQNLKVNGQASKKPWLPGSFIAKGGTLDFTLGSSANTTWGASPNDAPPSYQYGQSPVRISFKSSRAVVAPGGSTQVSVIAQSITNSTTIVNWSATVPSGFTLRPASGSLSVPAYGSASQTFTVSAGSSMAQDYYDISFSAQRAGGPQLPSFSLPVVVAQPGDLLAFYNNMGISNDNNTSVADYDDYGSSYSAQALAKNGYTPGATVKVNGISYTWPNVPAATYDNIAVFGQTMQTPRAKAGATHLTFLGSAINGNTQGTITITYIDGSTQTAQLGLSDWTLGTNQNLVAYNNVVATQMSYHNSVDGTPQQVTTYIFATAPITLTRGKKVASITLPRTVSGGTLHIFALAIS